MSEPGKSDQGGGIKVPIDNHHGMTQEEHRQFLATNLVRTAVSYAEIPGMLKSVVVVLEEKNPEGYKEVIRLVKMVLGWETTEESESPDGNDD